MGFLSPTLLTRPSIDQQATSTFIGKYGLDLYTCITKGQEELGQVEHKQISKCEKDNNSKNCLYRHNKIQLLQAVVGLIGNHKEVVWKKVLFIWLDISISQFHRCFIFF